MIEGLVFPSVRDALFDLIDGHEHLGETVQAVFQVQADSYGSMAGPFPVCQVYVTNGPEGFIDRVERVTLECYAPGQAAVDTLESIRASVVGWDVDTPSGYLDKVRCVEVPTEVPYQSGTLNKATCLLDVTVRPLN